MHIREFFRTILLPSALESSIVWKISRMHARLGLFEFADEPEEINRDVTGATPRVSATVRSGLPLAVHTYTKHAAKIHLCVVCQTEDESSIQDRREISKKVYGCMTVSERRIYLRISNCFQLK